MLQIVFKQRPTIEWTINTKLNADVSPFVDTYEEIHYIGMSGDERQWVFNNFSNIPLPYWTTMNNAAVVVIPNPWAQLIACNLPTE